MTEQDPQYAAILARLNEGNFADNEHDDLLEQLQARYRLIGRGGTTPGGLPYPYPTDPVSEGASAIRALAEAIDAGADTGWIPAPLLAGVTSYAPDTWGVVAYRKRNGDVWIRGVLYRASAGGTTMFNLPAGMRPLFGFQTAGISIQSNGDFTWGGAAGTTTSLGQIHFLPEQ